MMNRTLKTVPMLVAAALALAASGCSRDAEIQAFLGDFDAFSTEIVKKVKMAPDPSAGVTAAQQYLDENKDAIRRKLEAVKSVKNFQVSEETKKKMEDSFKKDAEAVAGLELDYVAKAALDAAFRTRIEKLIGDYRDVITK
jgi:hypothetical protein